MQNKNILILIAALLAFSLFGCSKQNNAVSSTATFPGSSSEILDSSSEEFLPESDTAEKTSSTAYHANSETAASRSNSSKAAVSSTAPRKEISVLIPPGFTVRKIAARLEAKGICKSADFIKAVNEGDFSAYSIVSGITNPEKRCYRLEGYLYPDTYTFYQNSKAEDVVKKILQNTQKKLAGKYSYSNMTLDQIITLASLIEKEGGGSSSESANISSVIHNRLTQPKPMPLQLDAPIYYLENEMGNADTQKYKIWYNTYNNTKKGYDCPGLPAGAICSPSANSLKAAANPADTDYLYFGSDKNKKYFYAATDTEFKQKAEAAGVTIS